MGLFDQIGRDKTTGHMSFVQEAAAFGKLDLNTIFREGSMALIEWFIGAVKLFGDLFGRKTCTVSDGAMVERMIDQVPGMVIVAAKLGWVDASLLDAYNDNKNRADYISNPYKHQWCNDVENVARAFFTVLFGVRIGNVEYLDNLEHGADAYYATNNGYGTSDIPRAAVDRAVMLKKTYFPASSYNTWLWNMQKFQDYPLVAPVPDPFTPGKLWTGDIFGVKVVDGYVIGNAVPDLPTSTTDPFLIKDPWSDILYSATHKPTVKTPTANQTTVDNQNFFDRLLSYVKANPVPSAAMAAVAVYAISEVSDEIED